MKDYYKLLEVSKSATQEEIKRSYRRLALKYHPDKTSYSGAAQLFANINEAYNVLGKKESRALYDLKMNRPVSPPTYHTTNTSQKRPNPYSRSTFTGQGNPYGYQGSPHVNSQVDIRPYVKYFKRISLGAFVFCVLISFDYFLPAFKVPDQIMAKTYKRARQQYELQLTQGYFYVAGEETRNIRIGQKAVLSYTPLFDKLIKVTLVIDNQEYDYHVQVSIYRSFSFALIILLITSYLGTFQLKKPESIMNFAIVNVLLFVLVFVFLSMS